MCLCTDSILTAYNKAKRTSTQSKDEEFQAICSRVYEAVEKALLEHKSPNNTVHVSVNHIYGVSMDVLATVQKGLSVIGIVSEYNYESGVKLPGTMYFGRSFYSLSLLLN